jgi:hypothetical protein
MEVLLVNVYALDSSSLFMLAARVAGTRALSTHLGLIGSIPNYRYNNEWTFCFSFCADHASSENSPWTWSKMRNNELTRAGGFHSAFSSF